MPAAALPVLLVLAMLGLPIFKVLGIFVGIYLFFVFFVLPRTR
jgi:hypothetical protein